MDTSNALGLAIAVGLRVRGVQASVAFGWKEEQADAWGKFVDVLDALGALSEKNVKLIQSSWWWETITVGGCEFTGPLHGSSDNDGAGRCTPAWDMLQRNQVPEGSPILRLVRNELTDEAELDPVA